MTLVPLWQWFLCDLLRLGIPVLITSLTIHMYHRSGNFHCFHMKFCPNRGNKKHEIYFTTDIHYSQNIFVCTISQQLFRVRRSLWYQQVSWAHGKPTTTFRSVSVFTATERAYSDNYSVPFCMLVVCQQLHGSHQRSQMWHGTRFSDLEQHYARIETWSTNSLFSH